MVYSGWYATRPATISSQGGRLRWATVGGTLRDPPPSQHRASIPRCPRRHPESVILDRPSSRYHVGAGLTLTILGRDSQGPMPVAPTYPPCISRRPSSVDTDSSTASNIPPTGRDARARHSPSGCPAETTHCRRGARASHSAHPAETPTEDEAPARASAGGPLERCLYGRRPRGSGRPTPPVATARTPLETPLESPVGPRRPRGAAGRERPQRPPRGPGRKSESRLAILDPRPTPRRALVGNRALRGRGHICCKSHTNSRSRNHLGANEAGAAGRPTKVGPRIYEGGGERGTDPERGDGASGTHPLKPGAVA